MVRFCRSARRGYEVGLEFPSGTGWSPALRDKLDLLNLASEIGLTQPVPRESLVDLVVPSDELRDPGALSFPDKSS